MKFLGNPAVLLTAAGSASAAATGFFTPQDQQVIGKVADVVESVKETVFDGLSAPLEKLRANYDSLEGDVRAAWDEVATLFPEDMKLENFMTHGKKASRRPDSEWDHIVRGKDVQSLWVENAQGQKERELDGKLENFNLRVKAVDPEKLGVDPGVKQYSGYIDDEEEDKHLFYWFFESRNDPKNDPVVLWLNGGPGCSSLTGLFFELGPSSINTKAEPVLNPHSWNANASVIFLDQPVNVGYSYSSGGVSNTVAAAKDVYAFLTLWFKQFPQYAKQDFHIAGESYAGHYIPVFASEILSHKNRNINLKSLLIGNGLTDGLTQQAYYEPFACGEGGWPAVLDESECQSMKNALPRCESLVQSCYDSESIWTCVPAAIYCNNAMIGPYQRSGQNPYDIRKPCGSNPLCYDGLGDIETFLNKPAVMKALGVEVSEYTGCNGNINRNFLFNGDWMKPYHRLVPDLIKQIPVLIYAGDADFICNWMGNHAWTEALEWHGQKKFNDQKLKKFQHSTKGFDIGLQKAHGNFSFMTIHAAGHMVPYDKPEGALDMLNRWIGGEWFDV